MIGRIVMALTWWYLRRDTAKCLAAAARLPELARLEVAGDVWGRIMALEAEIQDAPDNDAERWTIAQVLQDAMARRHYAIINGARDHANPDWLQAALFESWLNGRYGGQGTKGEKMADAVERWALDTLPPLAEICPAPRV